MKVSKYFISSLAFIAMLAMFFKLPDTPTLFNCKMCVSDEPYLPLIGTGYFATLLFLFLLVPGFPRPWIARLGMVFAFVLGIGLTYYSYPQWCIACLIAHACHLLIWIISSFRSALKEQHSLSKERLCLIFLAPLATVTFFASINLTFMAYDFKAPTQAALKVGDQVPTSQNFSYTVLNFITPGCFYCKEQLPILNAVAEQIDGPYRFVQVSPDLPDALVSQSPTSEWIRDGDGKLRELFRVNGYPTLFVIDQEGKIAEIIAGVPERLEVHLLKKLKSK